MLGLRRAALKYNHAASYTLPTRATSALASRAFSTSSVTLQTATVATAPVKKPVGAFRGGMFGFLLGSTLAGAGVYYYILEEYRVSNALLTEDIYNLQAAVQRMEAYTLNLYQQVTELQRKK